MNQPDPKELLGRRVGSAFIILGGLVVMAGLLWLLRTAAFVSRAAKAPGQVITVERSRGSKGGFLYFPVFAFTDSAGIVHTQRTTLGSSHYSFESGERVTVLYDSETPNHSKIDSFTTVWLGPVFITAFGALFGGFACFWRFLWTRAIRRQKP